MNFNLMRPNCSAVDFENCTTWHEIRDQANHLRLLQNVDGSLDADTEKIAAADQTVDGLIALLHDASSWLPYQQQYLDALVADLKTWKAMAYPKPDFSESLKAFTPEQHRQDGVLYFALFPMFTLNGSKNVTFEAVVFIIVWPDWLARVNHLYCHNEKFVSAELIDYTKGYDSECATLFPETVSVAGKAENNFGVIFCNREAARCTKFANAAHEIWGIEKDEIAMELLSDTRKMQEAYSLWDVLHDRSHFEGPLPFHIYMVRQRNPYFMYALEEARVDITSYVKSLRLIGEGFVEAKFVPKAIIYDRVLRFTVIDGRAKNLESLAGQFIFGALHKCGAIEINHGKLTIDWQKVNQCMVRLLGEIERLYRSGQNLSKLEHWFACHDFINQYVGCSRASVWTKANRKRHLDKKLAEWIDATLVDEFPLNLFFVSYRRKLNELEIA